MITNITNGHQNVNLNNNHSNQEDNIGENDNVVKIHGK